MTTYRYAAVTYVEAHDGTRTKWADLIAHGPSRELYDITADICEIVLEAGDFKGREGLDSYGEAWELAESVAHHLERTA